jgi:hypothetical protein
MGQAQFVKGESPARQKVTKKGQEIEPGMTKGELRIRNGKSMVGLFDFI